jgi:uncharacterized protein (TIGR02646 family)
MILIKRGDEHTQCPSLAEIRAEELRRVRPLIAAGTAIGADLLGKRYTSARGALYARQHHKCCDCEAKPNSQRWHGVEHIRPKVRYWWLTWTWDNLLFACHDCNNAKRDHFPLGAGSTPLEPEDAAPGAELPLLLDPAREDPRAHIRFVPQRIGGSWFPVHRTERGREMLRALKWIDAESIPQDGLLDQWQHHVDSLRETLLFLRTSFASENRSQIQDEWIECTRRRRRASQPFVALTLDVLEHHFYADIERWTLPLEVIDEPDPPRSPPSLSGPSVA